MPGLPAGTVTFLFTDIEGSTHMLHHLGDDGYARALADHNQVLRTAFAAHSGHELQDHGDGFLIVFPTAQEAVCAAVQERLGIVLDPDDRAPVERDMQFTRGALGDEAFEAAYAEGRRLSLEQAVESALTHVRALQG